MTLLHLPVHLATAVLTHARAAHPFEVCGVLPGRGSPERHVPMRNVSDRPVRRFAFDPDAQLELWQELDEAGEDPVVIYHSHTVSEAEPSATDRAAFLDPGVHYLIATTVQHPQQSMLRSWRLVDGSLVEEPVIMVAAPV